MSDNAATECTRQDETSCPVHAPAKVGPDELRQLVSRALVGLSARPLSIVTGHLTHDQVTAACRALDVDPGPVVQLSIVAVRGGAQLVVWAHE